MLKLANSEEKVSLDSCEKPEFDSWRWIHYSETVDQVISFKRTVYCKALEELMPLIKPDETVKLIDSINQQ